MATAVQGQSIEQVLAEERRERAERQSQNLKLLGVFAIMFLYPFFDKAVGLNLIGSWLSIMIFLMLAMGLNIVVGYAGLLDLGYAAFFAIGAYAMALLTSPQSVLI